MSKRRNARRGKRTLAHTRTGSAQAARQHRADEYCSRTAGGRLVDECVGRRAPEPVRLAQAAYVARWVA